MQKLTEEHLTSLIIDAQYHVFPGTTLTVCCLTLRNGYNVVGESACVKPEDFDEEIGRKYAYEKAFNKIWELEGYVQKNQLIREAEKRFNEREQK